MKSTLKLEYIGADSADWLNAMCRQFNRFGGGDFGDKFIGRPSPGPWVAEVTGKYPSGKLQRLFVRSHRDYSRANSKGSRGVYRENHGRLKAVPCIAELAVFEYKRRTK